jgi:hypothetical protein
MDASPSLFSALQNISVSGNDDGQLSHNVLNATPAQDSRIYCAVGVSHEH